MGQRARCGKWAPRARPQLPDQQIGHICRDRAAAPAASGRCRRFPVARPQEKDRAQGQSMMTILGISISHDGTLSVLRDGAHVFSIAEERLSRNKGHIGFPFRALAHVFEQGIVAPGEVECVALAIDHFRQGSNRILDFELAEGLPYYDIMNSPAPEGFSLEKRLFNRDMNPDQLRDAFLGRVRGILDAHGCAAPIELVDHHLSHAASAVFNCTIADPLVVTMDGEGDGLSASVSVLEDGRLRRIASVSDRMSLGNIYSHVTRQLGYKVSRHEGKITGLAAFGDPSKGLKLLMDMVSVENGKIAFRGGLGVTAGDLLAGRKTGFYRARPRKIAARIAHLGPADQAAAVQAFLERSACAFISHWLRQTGKRGIALAGGVFANVKLNQHVAALDEVDEIFVFPNMGDGGNALGAALIAQERRSGQPVTRREMPHAYWGPASGRAQIEAAFAASGANLHVQEPEDLPALVAQTIHAGGIVGWFQGGMEYGPRALGARSIVARPTERHLNEELNRRLSRTEFMPFAPSCLIEKGAEVFVIDKPGTVHTAEFMTITYDVRPEWSARIGAVVHVDNTARPQFVDPVQNPGYHAMISAYEALSGLPLVVNTSFNVHEEPIVCVPEEGLRALTDGVIDALAIGPFYVTQAG